jgi:acyl carrier protein
VTDDGQPVEADRRDDIAQSLRLFIVEELLEEPYFGSDPLADQAIDSLAVEQIVEFVDEEYGVVISDSEMVARNFETLGALATLIVTRQRERAAER